MYNYENSPLFLLRFALRLIMTFVWLSVVVGRSIKISDVVAVVAVYCDVYTQKQSYCYGWADVCCNSLLLQSRKPQRGVAPIQRICQPRTPSTLTLRLQIGPSRASQEFHLPKYEYFNLQWILHAYRRWVCSYPTHDRWQTVRDTTHYRANSNPRNNLGTLGGLRLENSRRIHRNLF